MKRSIDVMVNKLIDILGHNIAAIYLYGSVPMDDFKFGWSDIDLLCITKEAISDEKAQQ